MKNLLHLLSLYMLFSCSTKTQEINNSETYLIRVSEEPYEFGASFTYININGDTIVPLGKYTFGYADTITNYGIVMRENGELIAINPAGKELYRVFNYDNGPDYPSEGLFRIVQDGKIGYADEATGKIVIAPKYECAWPFEDGKAKVSLKCGEEKMDEYSMWISEEWIFIDKEGKKAEE